MKVPTLSPFRDAADAAGLLRSITAWSETYTPDRRLEVIDKEVPILLIVLEERHASVE